MKNISLPGLYIPSAKHFCSRHAGHRLRLGLSTTHLLSFLQRNLFTFAFSLRNGSTYFLKKHRQASHVTTP
jgi:hypothetical protein